MLRGAGSAYEAYIQFVTEGWPGWTAPPSLTRHSITDAGETVSLSLCGFVALSLWLSVSLPNFLCVRVRACVCVCFSRSHYTITNAADPRVAALHEGSGAARNPDWLRVEETAHWLESITPKSRLDAYPVYVLCRELLRKVMQLFEYHEYLSRLL